MSRTPAAPRGFVLPGLSDQPTGVALTILTLLVVLGSRVLLLPDGPWEQDEALMAAGVLDFDVTRHRPHPPGFVGWIAVGKLVHLVCGDAILALQLASSAASVLLFWAMSHLLARITPGGRATLLALAFTFAPLAWVHAPRAFSTTPALALAALALWLWPRTERAHVLGWASLGLAATVRPQLGPELAVLAAAAYACPSIARGAKLRGTVLATVFVGLAILITVHAGPDPAAVGRAFVDHFQRHRSDVDGLGPWANLGFVKGLGHPGVAVGLTGISLLGLVAAGRTRLRQGTWLTGLVVVTAWMVLRHHEPTFPRYGLALLAAAMPAIAWASTLVARAWTMRITIAAILVGVVGSLGPILDMRDRPLPIVTAARAGATAPDAAMLAYSHGSFSFARLAAERTDTAGVDVLDIEHRTRFLPRTYMLEGRTLRLLDGATVCRLPIEPAPERAMRLGQSRFQRAALSRDGLPLGPGFFAPERDDAGEQFAWMSSPAILRAPQGSKHVYLALDVPSDMDGAHLTVRAGASTQVFRTHTGPMQVDLELDCVRGCDVTLETDRFHDAPDDRALALMVDGAWVSGPDHHPAYGRWSPGLPRSVRSRGVALEGFLAPETFARGRPGAWTAAAASMTFPARPGVVRIRLARPEHTAGDVTLATDADRKTMHIGPEITIVSLETDAPNGQTSIQLTTPTFVPADVRDGSADRRNLGLIVYDVEFLPNGDPCRPDHVSSVGGGTEEP